MIDKLQAINKTLISKYQNNPSLLKKQLLIQKLLKEPNCFFKMDIQTAYNILNDLQFNEETSKNIYLDLIDARNYDAKITE